MQDFTGVPAVVDLANMRDSVKALGGQPELINPEVSVDLVIDHLLQVDYSGSEQALQLLAPNVNLSVTVSGMNFSNGRLSL